MKLKFFSLSDFIEAVLPIMEKSRNEGENKIFLLNLAGIKQYAQNRD